WFSVGIAFLSIAATGALAPALPSCRRLAAMVRHSPDLHGGRGGHLGTLDPGRKLECASHCEARTAAHLLRALCLCTPSNLQRVPAGRDWNRDCDRRVAWIAGDRPGAVAQRLKAQREEKFMLSEFGDRYAQYQRETGFLLPRL